MRIIIEIDGGQASVGTPQGSAAAHGASAGTATARRGAHDGGPAPSLPGMPSLPGANHGAPMAGLDMAGGSDQSAGAAPGGRG